MPLKKFFIFFIRNLLFLTALSTQLSANENFFKWNMIKNNPYFKFISLGGTCHTAIALNEINLRVESHPFDWIISTNHDIFLKVLKNEFQYFTDPEYFEKKEGVPYAFNLYYGLHFPHDFSSNGVSVEEIQKQWDIFKSKYDRRIERFIKLRNYGGKVFFFRTIFSNMHENQEFKENTKRAKELRLALEKFFPSLDFTLVILSYNDLDIPIINNVNGVVEFRIGRSCNDLKTALFNLLNASY